MNKKAQKGLVSALAAVMSAGIAAPVFASAATTDLDAKYKAAYDAVQAALKSNSQKDLTAARVLVDALYVDVKGTSNEFLATTLSSLLDPAQQTKLVELFAAIDKADASVKQADINASRDLILDMPQVWISTFSSRIDTIQQKMIDKVVAAIDKAEKSGLQADIDAAKALIDELATVTNNNDVKTLATTTLKARIDKVLANPTVDSVSAVTNTNTLTVNLKDDATAELLTGKTLTLTPATGTAVTATFKSVNGKVATFEFDAKTAEGEYVVTSDKLVVAEGTKVVYDKTAPTLKVEDSKFTDYKTMKIALSEKVTGTPVVKINGVAEKAENVALAEDGMSIIVSRSSEFVAQQYTIVVNGLKDVASNAMIPDATIIVTKDASYPASFTNITTGITNSAKDIYFTAVDQYGKSFDITTDNSYKVTATVNGMPLTTEVSLATANKMAKVSLTKTLAENDAVTIKLEKFNKNATLSDAKLLTTISSSYTVAKDAAAVAKSIQGITSSASTILAGDAAVTLTADVRDQFNNPADLSVNQLRWVVEQGGDLLDPTTGDLQSDVLTVDKNGNTASFKAVNPGTIIISAYNIVNGAKATYTVKVGAAKLTTLALTSENPSTQYNNENIKYNKIAQNNGAVLTPDMIKFNVVAKTKDTAASDVTVTAALRGGTGADKNDIVISAKTTKVGDYEITPYVGTSFDADDAVKAAMFHVTTTLNPTATSIDAMSLPTLKVGTAQKVNLVVRNIHNEAIDATATDVQTTVYKNGQVSVGDVTVTELDKDGSSIAGNTGSTVVKALSFTAVNPGNYTVRVSVAGTVATYDVAVSAEVTTLQSIELGNNIVDNSVISNATDPVYRVISVKDNKGDEIIPNITGWVISKDGTNAIADFASIVYYKHDSKGAIVDATQATAEGIAVKMDPTAASVNAYTVDTTLTLTVGNKALNAADVIKDTLNVTVKAKSAVKSISIADTNVTVIPGASVKKEVVVLDQYGKAIKDPTMITAAAADNSKVTAVVSYDSTAKKMYITYTGVASGTDTVVVKSVADPTIKSNVNVTVGDNTNINSIAFDAYNYKVYNNATDDTKDQTVTLTYKVNGGALDVPASALNVIADSNLVDVSVVGSTIKVKAKAGANTAANGIGTDDAVITISVLTANGKTSSINLTLSDDAAVVDKSTVVVDSSVDEDANAAGTQMIIGKDADGNDVAETTGQIVLVGKDQYGVSTPVQAATTWASTDESIATVDANGLVTAHKPGKTTITGFYKGNLYTIEVVVPEAN